MSLQYEVDVIHGHFATHPKLGGRYAANYFNLPFTVTAHAYEIFRYGKRNTAKQILSTVDEVIVSSKYNEKFLSETVEINNSFSIVYATTNVDSFTPTDNGHPKRLLTVARLVEKKGYAYSLHAVSHLVDKYPDMALLD